MSVITFDPAIHETDTMGRPVLKSDGTPRLKRGRKLGSKITGHAVTSVTSVTVPKDVSAAIAENIVAKSGLSPFAILSDPKLAKMLTRAVKASTAYRSAIDAQLEIVNRARLAKLAASIHNILNTANLSEDDYTTVMNAVRFHEGIVA